MKSLLGYTRLESRQLSEGSSRKREIEKRRSRQPNVPEVDQMNRKTQHHNTYTLNILQISTTTHIKIDTMHIQSK